MFKICVVGCGDMATNGHGPSYMKYKAAHPDVTLAGCCDIIEKRALTFRDQFGFERAYADFKVMLDAEKPDVVCLISPVQYTCELAVEIVKRGFALLLEKPPGRTREEIERISRAADEAGVPVRSAFNRRYTPLVRALKDQMSDERIMNVTYQMYRKNRHEPDFSTTAIHAIDAVKHIAGSDYAHVDFVYQELPEAGDRVANIYMTARMENGAVAQLSLVPMGGSVAERATVNTDRASYYAELPFWKNPDSPGRVRRVEGNAVTADITGDGLVDSTDMYEECGFYEENRSWFDALRRGEHPGNDLPKAIQSVEVAACIRDRKPFYDKIRRL